MKAVQKTIMILSLVSIIPVSGFAKVADFNSMITDNMKAQAQLHTTVQGNVDLARVAVQENTEGNTVVETGSDSYNAPTRRGALTFDKEKKQPKKSQRAQFDRVATEISDSDF